MGAAIALERRVGRWSSDDEESGRLPLDASCDQDRPRLGGALDPRGDIGRFAEHFAGCVDHDLPGIKADPRGKLRRASCWRFWR